MGCGCQKNNISINGSTINGSVNTRQIIPSISAVFDDLTVIPASLLQSTSDVTPDINLKSTNEISVPNILEAYNSGTYNNGAKGSVTVIVAYGCPSMMADLDNYIKKYNIGKKPNLNIYYQSVAVDASLFIKSTTHPNNFTSNSIWAAETAMSIQLLTHLSPFNINLVVTISESMINIIKAIQFANTLNSSLLLMPWGICETEIFNKPNVSIYINSLFINPNTIYIAPVGNNDNVIMWPAVDSSVVSIGGTTLSVSLSVSDNIILETMWNKNSDNISSYIFRPSYQTYNQPFRSIPDVVTNGNPQTGVTIVVNGVETIYGGTSLSALIFTGLISRWNNYKQIKLNYKTIHKLLYNLPSRVYRQITQENTKPICLGAPLFTLMYNEINPIIWDTIKTLYTTGTSNTIKSGTGTRTGSGVYVQVFSPELNITELYTNLSMVYPQLTIDNNAPINNVKGQVIKIGKNIFNFEYNKQLEKNKDYKFTLSFYTTNQFSSKLCDLHFIIKL